MTEELGQLQKDILSIVAKNSNPFYVSELARVLDPPRDQTTVFKSVQLLLNWHLLKSKLEYKGGRSFLWPTPKGVHYAVFYCQVPYMTIVSAHSDEFETDRKSKETLKQLEAIGILDTFMTSMAKYSIKNDLYDEDGSWQLDTSRKDIERYKHHVRAAIIETTFELFHNPNSTIKQTQEAADIWYKWAERFFVKKSEIEMIVKRNS